MDKKYSFGWIGDALDEVIIPKLRKMEQDMRDVVKETWSSKQEVLDVVENYKEETLTSLQNIAKELENKIKIEKKDISTRPGEKGDKGEPGKTPTKNELIDLIVPLIPESTITQEKTIETIKEAVFETPEQVVEKINKVEEGIEVKSIKGLKQLLRDLASSSGGQTIANYTNSFIKILKNGVAVRESASNIDFGNNLTVTATPNGVRVDATGGGVGGGAAVYTDLTDAATVNLPTINTPLQTALSSKASTSHTHTASQVNDFSAAVSANSDVSANTTARHTHSNKALLDTYTQTEVDLADAVSKKHTHANQAVLDATTASFTTAQETKLSGIQAGAEVNVNADWNATTGDALILNKPTTFTPSAHTHAIADTTGLQAALDSKSATSHTHTVNDLSDVVITSPTVGQVIKYDGTNWINDTDATASGGSGVTDHGALTGLGDDDHTQYHNDTRGDARYYTKTLLDGGQLDNRYYTETEVDSALSGKAASTHSHAISDVTGLQTNLDGKVPYTGATSSVDMGAYSIGFDVASPTFRVESQGTNLNSSSTQATRYSTDTFGATLRHRKARGTSTTPTATVAGDISQRLEGQAHNGTTFSTVGTVDIKTKTAGTTPSGEIALSAANTSGTLTTLVTISNEGGLAATTPISSTKGFVKRSQTLTSTATITPSWDTDDNIFITAQAAAITIANPTGTPVNGQTIMIRIKDNGTARAITYGANYRAFGAALPTTTTISKTMYIGLVANTTDTKVDTTAMSEV